MDCRRVRDIVLNTRKPLIWRNFPHNWTCFKGTLEEWCQLYDDAVAGVSSFERISRSDASTPQWERKREVVQMTAMQFLQEHGAKECDRWAALNYKRVQELPAACSEGVDFGCFGFAHAAADCSFWLGSKGSNTPCHYDTYGCNIVVQVYGRKSWLLFPPEAPITSVRIPYEESSVYCELNFYAPTERHPEELKSLKDCAYHVILEPNDVLIVPRQWWHYVEALETSLSVNTWIPLELDLDAQLEECIVKFLIESFVKETSGAVKQHVLNPNQLQQIATESELFSVLQFLLDKAEAVQSVGPDSKKSQQQYAYHYLTPQQLDDLLKEAKTVSQVPRLTNTKYVEIINSNRQRCCGSDVGNEESPLNVLEELLINSICSPSIVRQIKQEFYNRYKAVK